MQLCGPSPTPGAEAQSSTSLGPRLVSVGPEKEVFGKFSPTAARKRGCSVTAPSSSFGDRSSGRRRSRVCAIARTTNLRLHSSTPTQRVRWKCTAVLPEREGGRKKTRVTKQAPYLGIQPRAAQASCQEPVGEVQPQPWEARQHRQQGRGDGDKYRHSGVQPALDRVHGAREPEEFLHGQRLLRRQGEAHEGFDQTTVLLCSLLLVSL